MITLTEKKSGFLNLLASRQVRHGILVAPLLLLFILFFVIPVGLMFLSSLNTPAVGTVELSSELTLKNYTRFFSRSSYLIAAGRSLLLASIGSFLSLLIAYPTALLIARTEHPGRVTFLTLLVLIAMQLDIVIRLYGMMVILGDNGLVNQMLLGLEIISKPLPLMYNFLGVVFGLVQFALPFMILTLVGVLRGIDPSLEEAARSLGANRFRCFFRVTLPASMPGILAGTLLVFALSVSSYIVPALMGGFRVGVLPIHIFQQVMQMAQFQFGAAVGVVLFLISLTSIAVYLRVGSSARGA